MSLHTCHCISERKPGVRLCQMKIQSRVKKIGPWKFSYLLMCIRGYMRWLPLETANDVVQVPKLIFSYLYLLSSYHKREENLASGCGDGKHFWISVYLHLFIVYMTLTCLSREKRQVANITERSEGSKLVTVNDWHFSYSDIFLWKLQFFIQARPWLCFCYIYLREVVALMKFLSCFLIF